MAPDPHHHICPVRDVVVGDVLRDVAGLAVECLADGIQRGEPDGARSAGLEVAEVGQGDVHAAAELGESHLSAREHDVEVDDDGPCRQHEQQSS
jgi:hypothetical protein